MPDMWSYFRDLAGKLNFEDYPATNKRLTNLRTYVRYMRKTAKFSKNRKYRYALYRIWDESDGLVNFIGLNPSTADEQTDDPTIRKCVEFARRWGYGGIVMTNLFAYRATNPNHLKLTTNPIGVDNDHWLLRVADNENVGCIVVAWGTKGAYLERNAEVQKLLKDYKLMHFRKTKDGHPEHPLYMPYDTLLKSYE